MNLKSLFAVEMKLIFLFFIHKKQKSPLKLRLPRF